MTATLSIGGVQYIMIEEQFDLTNALDERQRFKCDVIDYSGTTHFQKGEQVLVTDPTLGIIYSGYINSDKEVPQYPSGAILHSIDCIDQHYLADKRSYSRIYTTPQPAGKLVVDQLHDVLLAEGITHNFALRSETTQADFAQGILTGTQATLNLGEGDLELAAAGSPVTITENTTATFGTGTLTNMIATANSLTPSTVYALKMQSTLSFSYGVEFAQSQQSVSGTVSGTASGTASGNASGTVSANPSGNLNAPINTSVNYTPGGSIFISGGAPGESATFNGNNTNLNPTGTLSTTVNTSFSTSASLPFSTIVSSPFSAPFSSTVSPTYQPKTKSKVKIDETHYSVVTVDKAVADNRVDTLIWTGSMTIGSSDTLNYDIWISSTSPSQEGGVDLYFSDGTVMTEYLGSLDTNTDIGLWDQNLLSASPIQDLSDHARDTWYSRSIDLTIISGKTITAVSLFNAANIAGTFDLYIKNCYLGSHSGSPFFGTSQTTPTLNPPLVASIGAYITAATIITVAPVYDPAMSARISPAYSIDAVKLVKNSVISWTSSNPIVGPFVIPGAPGAATVGSSETIFASYDGTTWLPCTNNQPLPGLPAGANVAGLSLYLLETFSGGQDPTAIPSLLNLNVTLTSAVKGTTTDITSLFGSTAAWNTGTMEGADPNSNGDLVLGPTSYSWSNTANMTFVPAPSNSPTQSVSSGAYVVSSPGSAGTTWSSSRFNFISAAQDFTCEADFTLSCSSPAQNEIGFVYRQTYWGSPNNSFAYYVRVMQAPGGQAGGTSVSLGYGINSPPSSNVGGGPASGAYTNIAQVTETISNGTTYHVKVVVSENRHIIFWNHGSTPIIDILDNTYTAAGNVGLRTYLQGTNSSTNKIANFTITNTFAGLWTSPSLSLSSLGTCGNTQVSWSEINTAGRVQATALVMASLNGGSTWQQCTNGALMPSAPIPGLTSGTNVSGKSLLIQVILSSTGFLISPIITGLSIRVCGAFPGATGTYTTIPLGNDMSITRTVGSGWGTAFDGQAWAQVGTGTTAVATGEETIANTTGDVHMVLGSRTGTDEDGTARFQISASTIAEGMELRYVDTNNFYRLSASTTTISIIKKSGGTTYILATVATSIPINTPYRMRFRVVGSGPISLQGNVWADGTLEPIVGNPNNWTITTTD